MRVAILVEFSYVTSAWGFLEQATWSRFYRTRLFVVSCLAIPQSPFTRELHRLDVRIIRFKPGIGYLSGGVNNDRPLALAAAPCSCLALQRVLPQGISYDLRAP
ncbi:hypothetical protein F5X96DRAFT_272209 [Biscogniauxia mediterranea]|nr:hypothetical protein F5X96DRAFT_272209 [Biscogniauxia mediterranea]